MPASHGRRHVRIVLDGRGRLRRTPRYLHQPALAGVSRLARLCGRFGGAGSRRLPCAQVRQLPGGQRPLALVHVVPLQAEYEAGRDELPGPWPTSWTAEFLAEVYDLDALDAELPRHRAARRQMAPRGGFGRDCTRRPLAFQARISRRRASAVGSPS